VIDLTISFIEFFSKLTDMLCQFSTPTIQIQAENVAADIRSFARSEVKRLRQGYRRKSSS
jgi:hypothetical protein